MRLINPISPVASDVSIANLCVKSIVLEKRKPKYSDGQACHIPRWPGGLNFETESPKSVSCRRENRPSVQRIFLGLSLVSAHTS